ncbi:carboxymuconolactone decarboxylase family protein [Falsochrobactrum sp. TDYN1]|uniref:Carboxymuconolactone decarboxylase family protein n=1 Tax=Falsochrobactrum tianjinense TaxID=2706015 RepID=A0A949PJS0_9HYPH|nr:carboxymuconolactone decarboxylase family protein [Falsochrobactrum sp. TDYN1]MBV2142147.1 carboxymuconolactone decarboxylase family protein [Falsochrobactrum sp. TDYN1]
MSRDLSLRPLPKENWDPMLSNIIEDMRERPLNVHALMAHNPELLKAWWSFRNYSVGGGSLGRRAGELVILRVASHLKAWYEWASHVERGLSCGLSADEIERVNTSYAQWPAGDAILLTAVDELIIDHRLSVKTLSELRCHYNNQQILDIIAIHGMYVILGCMINTWGLELDPHIERQLPTKFTRETFEETGSSS